MLIPFKKEHLEIMQIRQHEREVLALSPVFGETLEQSTVSRSGIIDGRIIACGGVNVTLFGSGELWLIPSIYLKEHGITYLRFVRDWLDDVVKSFNLTRMQTASIDDDLHNKYMQFLGFEKEGKMKQYALGKDYCSWGRVWE
jgi:hypothetical protein